MMLFCPECEKSYRVPSAAVPPAGREVRCSACGATWFERGRIAEAVAAGAAGADVTAYYGVAEARGSAEELEDRALRGPVIEGRIVESSRESSDAPPEPPSDPSGEAEGTTNLPAVRVATPADAPTESPALAQLHALSIRFEQPPATWAAKPRGGEVPRHASRRIGTARFDALVGYVREGARRLARAASAAARRRGPARRAGPTYNGGEVAARRTRRALRARAANRLTPLRALGWVSWASGAVAAGAVALAPHRVAERLPALSFLAPAAPTRPVLTVEARLDRYVRSSQGPALLLSGVIRNEGPEVVPQLSLYVGAEAQAVPLPPVAVPPGGERPFRVRVLLPMAPREVTLGVAAAEGPSPTEGFRMQTRGGAWGSGYAGPPPSLAGATGTR